MGGMTAKFIVPRFLISGLTRFPSRRRCSIAGKTHGSDRPSHFATKRGCHPDQDCMNSRDMRAQLGQSALALLPDLYITYNINLSIYTTFARDSHMLLWLSNKILLHCC